MQTYNILLSTNEISSDSVIATASTTPVPERDATLLESTPAPGSRAETAAERSPIPLQQPEEMEDLGAIRWYYRDPGGQEQGS